MLMYTVFPTNWNLQLVNNWHERDCTPLTRLINKVNLYLYPPAASKSCSLESVRVALTASRPCSNTFPLFLACPCLLFLPPPCTHFCRSHAPSGFPTYSRYPVVQARSGIRAAYGAHQMFGSPVPASSSSVSTNDSKPKLMIKLDVRPPTYASRKQFCSQLHSWLSSPSETLWRCDPFADPAALRHGISSRSIHPMETCMCDLFQISMPIILPPLYSGVISVIYHEKCSALTRNWMATQELNETSPPP
jgi:hypothetical protein